MRCSATKCARQYSAKAAKCTDAQHSWAPGVTGEIAGGDEPIEAYIGEDGRITGDRWALGSDLGNRTVPTDELDIGHANETA